MYVAKMETRHFSFEAYGNDEHAARRAMRNGLAKHAEQYGVAESFFDHCEVQTYRITAGQCFRDNAPLLTQEDFDRIHQESVRQMNEWNDRYGWEADQDDDHDGYTIHSLYEGAKDTGFYVVDAMQDSGVYRLLWIDREGGDGETTFIGDFQRRYEAECEAMRLADAKRK